MTEVSGAAAPVLHCKVAVIGGGPAGLMVAQVLSEAGVAVHLFDAMPSVGRKFLLAGKGGLNLTHSEPEPLFGTRYGARTADLAPSLAQFGPGAVRAWAASLGVDTLVGSSGRVFPTEMKAAPLLRAWLHRLRHPAHPQGVPVQFHMRHRWHGWDEVQGDVPGQGGLLRFDTPQGPVAVQAQATVLALGGASWSRLGSDGAWVPWLTGRGASVAPLLPANGGFEVKSARQDRGWSPFFASRFAGQPFKSVAIRCSDSQGQTFSRRGEFVATDTGVEGSLIYAASALLRDEIIRNGSATFFLDLLPDRTAEKVLAEVSHPRGSRSLGSHLKSRLGLDGIKAALLNELCGTETLHQPAALAQAIKALPVTLVAARPLDEAISTAGGVTLESLDAQWMLRSAPGVFCAGEMLDWEAPTGGYLLTACLATGRAAGEGVLKWLEKA